MPFSIQRDGSRFRNQNGSHVRPVGVNISGAEFNNFNFNTIFGDPGADTSYNVVKQKGGNCIRIPLNEQSWLGINGRWTGQAQVYQQKLQTFVDACLAIEVYVILDLHWTCPDALAADEQQPMANASHSLQFWSEVATAYKGRLGVMFECFNEPFDWWYDGDPIQIIYHGGHSHNVSTNGNPQAYSWDVAGMQQIVDTIRSTGASNVILVGGHDWCSGMDAWVVNKPNDPLGQLAAAWHPYPGQTQSTSYPQNTSAVPAILNAGYPVIATETGDHNSPGTKGAPFMASILPFIDGLNQTQGTVGVTAWTFDPWQNQDNILIKDWQGTPSDGYGVAFFNWLATAAAKEPQVIITQQAAPNPTSVARPGSVSSSGKLKNAGTNSVTLKSVALAGRPPGGTHAGGPYRDFQVWSNETLSAGQEKEYQASQNFSASDPQGTWTTYITYQTQDQVWHDGTDADFQVN